MGVIEDGKISGFIPCDKSFAVHYPGYPSSTARAIQTLGGSEAILKARSSLESTNNNNANGKLELHFRPEDPYSHPISGELHPSNSFLLKLSKSKSKDKESHICADIVSRVPEAYRFEGMADYQHVIPVHAENARRKKRNWAEFEEPHFEKAGFVDLDHEDVMILLPQLFSPKDRPENIALKPSSTLITKQKQDEAVENHPEINMEPALAIDFDIKGGSLKEVSDPCDEDVPKSVNWREFIKQGTALWGWQMAVSELFEEKPIRPKSSITQRLSDRNLEFNFITLKRLLLTVAYYFSRGPFRRFWVRKGYDPRKDPDSRIYQRMDFRVPLSLRYCDDNATKGSERRWEDLCKFLVFPHKCQVSLQLCELDDDYIQQEIQKPSKLETCTYATGWFSPHVLESLRCRVMVRFLTAYPGTGAEKLLKAASDDFTKSKRACIHQDVLNVNQEEQPQIDKEVVADESNQNQTKVTDKEVDEIEEEYDAYEADDGEEEFDEAEADENGEISLESHSYSDIENSARNYMQLQELFVSFPSMDTPGDKLQDVDNTDAEYEIYEQDGDDDENDADDDD